MNQSSEINLVLEEEFPEPVLVKSVPKGSLFLGQRSGFDLDMFGTACFVVTHAAGEVQGEEGGVERGRWGTGPAHRSLGEGGALGRWEEECFRKFHVTIQTVLKLDLPFGRIKMIFFENKGGVLLHGKSQYTSSLLLLHGIPDHPN